MMAPFNPEDPDPETILEQMGLTEEDLAFTITTNPWYVKAQKDAERPRSYGWEEGIIFCCRFVSMTGGTKITRMYIN